MKFRLLLSLMLASLFAAVSFAENETDIKGTIRGTVVDGNDNYPLIGATVRIEGTGLGAVTDLNGNYTIKNVPDGTYTVVISYVSYVTRTIKNVVVSDKKATVLTTRLSTDEELLGEVVVVAEGNDETESKLLLNRKRALVATVAIGAQELSRKGIGDARAAVAQISGVSRQEGQKNVFVRGLADRYNATTLNGFPMPSDDPEYKNIALDIFDTDMIQSVGVSKVFDASNGGEVGGAVIDIESKELVGDHLLEVSVDGGSNTSLIGNRFFRQDGTNYWGISNRNEPARASYDASGNLRADIPNPFGNRLTPSVVSAPINHSFGIKLGKRLDLGSKNELSLLLIGNHAKGYSYSDRIDRSFQNNADYTPFSKDQQGNKSTIDTRQIVFGNASLDLGNEHEIDYNILAIHSNNQYVDYAFGVGEDSETITESPDQQFQTGRIRQQANDNLLLVNQLQTSWTLGDAFTLKAGGAVNLVRSYEPDRRSFFYLGGYNVEAVESSTGQAYSGLGWNPNSGGESKERFFSDLREDDYNAKVSFRWDYAEKSNLTVGYDFRHIKHDFAARKYQVRNAVGKYYPDDQKYDIPWDELYDFSNSDGQGFPVEGVNNEAYAARRTLHSPYIAVTHSFGDRLSLMLGFRYDFLSQELSQINEDLSSGNRYVTDYPADLAPQWLPSVNLRYDITPEHTLRLGFSKTYILPRFKETIPYQYVNISFASQGNRYLKLSEAYNADLKYDWYITPTELLSATIFYKNFTNPIIRAYVGGSAGIEEYHNASLNAHVAGIELELKKDLLDKYNSVTGERHKLTGGIAASYLYTGMDLDFPYANDIDIFMGTLGNFPERRSMLEGASPWTGNADLSYTYTRDEKDYSAALLLNFFSDRIYSIGTIGAQQYDFIEKGQAHLNFIASADITRRLSVKLKVNNLLDTPFRLTERMSDFGVKSIMNQPNNPSGSAVYPGNIQGPEWTVDDPYVGTDFSKPFVMNEYRTGISFSLGLTYKF